MAELEELENDLEKEVDAADSLDALERVRVAALGKKGRITELMKTLGGMDPEERREKGPAYNGLKSRIAARIEARRDELHEAALAEKLAGERVDVSLPVDSGAMGRIHPVSQVMDELAEIFADLGFSVAQGPHIENDFYNFTALNIPEEHPARQMFDTFYINAEVDGTRKVLRTHTSPVQIRTMLTQEPPIRIIAPGRTFRSDSDATHTPMFHQVEGLVIDESTHMGHLKGCVESFVTAFFEVEDVRMRFRPSYFPFTEPSAEVDVNYTRVGDEIRIGEGDDWLEIMGCGMVHPRVIAACDLDPERYQGFAFGCGIDRLAMLKYGMPDLRAFFEADLRWLRHYGFAALDVPSIAGGLSR